jgi:hypothetical protein
MHALGSEVKVQQKIFSRCLREPFSYRVDYSRFRRAGFRSLAIFILLIADSGGL